MEHNINKLKEIREAYAEDMGYKSFANMASSVNIVPRDISEIAKSYAEAVNSEIQAKCDRYEAALKWYADEGNYFGDNGELATAWKNKMPLKANEALSSGEWNKEELICPCCGGDGKETCTNPDHGFIDAVGGETQRLGCPVCGHDPNHKVKNGGACNTCDGTGKVNKDQFNAFCKETGYDKEPVPANQKDNKQ